MTAIWKQFLFKTLIAGVVGLITTIHAANADTIVGIVQKSSDQIYLKMADRSTYLIRPKSVDLRKELNRLKNDDFVIGQGIFLRRERVIELQAINSVGLKELLGFWGDRTSSIYEFKSFDDLNLYHLENPTEAVPVYIHTGQFKYSISPDQDNRWAIFISGNDTVHLGLLEIRSDEIDLTLLNQETGKPEATFTLSRIGVRPNGLSACR